MKNLVSTLGFGGAALTSMKSYTDVKDLLNLVFELGIRHFDTAPLYGKGYSELIYGHFLKDKRKDITITTKFGLGNLEKTTLPVQALLPLNYHLKRIKNAFRKTTSSENSHTPLAYRQIDKKYIETSFQNSLSRLQTDYIDYYLLHEGLPHFLTDDAHAYLLTLKKQGRIRFMGIGSNALDINTLNINDLTDWDVLQYEGGINQNTLDIKRKFSNKTHFHHSCIMGFTPLSIKQGKDTIGGRLALAALNNPEGKIIFSTRNKEHLSHNIEEFLKNLETNAVH